MENQTSTGKGIDSAGTPKPHAQERVTAADYDRNNPLYHLPFSLNLTEKRMDDAKTEINAQNGIAPGMTSTDILLRLNPPGSITPVPMNARFAARDGIWKQKFRTVMPLSMSDPYVFSQKWRSDVQNIKRDTLSFMRMMTDRWAELGFPVYTHPTLGVEVPDDRDITTLFNLIKAKEGLTPEEYLDAQFILGNMDSFPKFTIQRYVPPGWYIQKVSGKSVPLSPLMVAVGIANFKGRRALSKTERGLASQKDVEATNYDPKGTNVGWPLYFAAVKDGIDTAKARLMKLFSKVAVDFKINVRGAYNELKKKIGARANALGLDSSELTFASAVSRRSRIGNKIAQILSLDEISILLGFGSGFVIPRIVFMFSHLMNLILSAIMPVLKGTRKLMFGGFTDETAVKRVNDFRLKFDQALIQLYTTLKSAKSRNNGRTERIKKFTIENDASGFDSNVSIEVTDLHAWLTGIYLIGNKEDLDLFESCFQHALRTTGFTKGVMSELDRGVASSSKFSKEFFSELDAQRDRFSAKALNVIDMLLDIRRVPILLPDINNKEGEYGVLAFRGTAQLPSGTKPTGEIGSDVTDLCCSTAYCYMGYWTLEDVMLKGAGMDPPRDKPFYCYLGDDNIHYSVPMEDLKHFEASMNLVYSTIGVEASLLFSDRFLMKHTAMGSNRPVLGRIWQQRISNESVPKHMVIYSMGVISSLDNLFGDGSLQIPANFGYTYHPRKDGNTKFMDTMIRHVMSRLLALWEKAVIPPVDAINFTRAMLDGDVETMKRVKSEVEGKIPSVMDSLKKREDFDPISDDFVGTLLRDRDSPATAAVLNALLNGDDGELQRLIAGEEVASLAFFEYEKDVLALKYSNYATQT